MAGLGDKEHQKRHEHLKQHVEGGVLHPDVANAAHDEAAQPAQGHPQHQASHKGVHQLHRGAPQRKRAGDYSRQRELEGHDAGSVVQ